jgi:acyl-CoA thioesterase FadM
VSDFRRQLRFEHEVEVRLRVIGNSAKTLTYQAVIVRQGEIAAVGRHTTICVSRPTGAPIKAIDMPEQIVAAFRNCAHSCRSLIPDP